IASLFPYTTLFRSIVLYARYRYANFPSDSAHNEHGLDLSWGFPFLYVKSKMFSSHEEKAITPLVITFYIHYKLYLFYCAFLSNFGLAKIILPADVCRTLVINTFIFLLLYSLPSSTIIIVSSSK